MARRRWYRRYPRVVAAKKKWASHFQQGSISANGTILVENASNVAAPTPVILKAGNIKVQGDVAINSASTGTASLIIYLMYVPEGMPVSSVPANHPEYLMGWTVVDAPTLSSGILAANKYSITSRLKRNLNSGDRIILYYEYTTTSTGSLNFEVSYNAQYFTCSN